MSATPADLASLFEEHRGVLFGVAYRMLGSASEAEDVLQSAAVRLLRRGLDGIESPRAFLITTVSRLSLDALTSARATREHYVGLWLPEPVMLDAEPADGVGDALVRRESVSLAFLVLMEALSPRERAVFLLREVFELPYAEVARIVERSEVSCRQLFRRARAQLAAPPKRFVPEPERTEALLESFLEALRDGDLTRLIESLHEDVLYESDGGGVAPAALRPIIGRAPVGRLIVGLWRKLDPSAFAYTLQRVNREPSLLMWFGGRLFSVVVPEFDGDRARRLMHVVNPDKLTFLAGQLDAEVAIGARPYGRPS